MNRSVGDAATMAGCLVLVALVFCSIVAGAAEQDDAKRPGEAGAPAVPVSRDEARRQARLLHQAMHNTLQAVHHQYFHEDENLVLPAAMMKDIFDELEQEQRVKLRWLVVDGTAMNSDHKAKNQFERDAVEALKAGQREFEWEEQGHYRRAGAIALLNPCLKCHVPNRTNLEERTAGLIISIPVKAKPE
ncbi:MAG: DUF3365 domain-containing protein [Planctomycetes bacterium]|nr:DUF3365 domain-containing protein [Planctomycetota bacterium]